MKQKGFVLLELLVTICIIALILAGVGIWQVSFARSIKRLDRTFEQTRSVQNMLEYTRALSFDAIQSSPEKGLTVTLVSPSLKEIVAVSGNVRFTLRVSRP